MSGLAWQEQGACIGSDERMFFPERGESTREAKAVCATCPVKAQCLDHALTNRLTFGIWGGTTVRERRRMLFERVRIDRSAAQDGPNDARGVA